MQIIKAVLLIAGAGLMTIMVLWKFGANFSSILTDAQSAISGNEVTASRDVLAPGAKYGGTLTSRSTSCHWRSRWCWAPPVCRTC